MVQQLRFFCLIFFMGGVSILSNAGLDLSQEGTVAFAQRVIKGYPEATWLTGDNVKATLQGEKGTPDISWSLQIYGKHYIEFERTVSSMLMLHVLNQGDKAASFWFTKHQKEGDRLTCHSFNEASTLVKSVVSRYSLKLLEVNLLLGDLGKTPTTHDLAQRYGITEGDHDIFLAACLEKCPEIFPTYTTLSPKDQQTIRSNAGLLHFGHLMHMEGTALAMLSKLKNSGILSDPQGFDFELVCHLCDISAALAHMNNEGSLVMIEPLYQNVKEAMGSYYGRHGRGCRTQKPL